MVTRYPWHFVVRWPYYALRPSVRRSGSIARHPLAEDLVPEEAGAAVRLLFVGDLMCLQGDRVPRCDPRLRDLFAGADLVVANCEAPVIRQTKNPRAIPLVRFAMASDYLRDFFEGFGVDPKRCALSVANNHIGDQGPRGLRETCERLAALGATPIGAHEGGPLAVVAVGGLRAGLAAWTQWLNRPCFPAGQGVWHADEVAGVDWPKERARAEVDLLVGFPHWEFEFQHVPAAATVASARALAAGGFSLIAGHHPHVLQPMDRLGEALCFYSLGNFFGTLRAWACRLGAILEVRVGRSGARRGRIVGYRVHPCIHDGGRVAPLEAAKPAWQARLRDRLGLLFDLRAEGPLAGRAPDGRH